MRPALVVALPIAVKLVLVAVSIAAGWRVAGRLDAGHADLDSALKTRDVRGWPLLVLALASLAGVEGYQAKMLTPPQLGAAETDDGVVLQTSGQSCGAASGANVARWFGVHASEREMARRFGTSSGTSAAQIIYGLRPLGIEGTPVTIAPARLTRLTPPALLLLAPDSPLAAGHVVTYVGEEHGNAVILDPLVGRVIWRLDRLPSTWKGHAIEFRHNPARPGTISRSLRTVGCCGGSGALRSGPRTEAVVQGIGRDVDAVRPHGCAPLGQLDLGEVARVAERSEHRTVQAIAHVVLTLHPIVELHVQHEGLAGFEANDAFHGGYSNGAIATVGSPRSARAQF